MKDADRPVIDGIQPASLALRNRLAVAAREVAHRPVFLAGEPGSGRRHAARVLHDLAGGGEFHSVAACAPDAVQQAVQVMEDGEGARTLYLDRVHDMRPELHDVLRAVLLRGLPSGMRLVSSHPRPSDALLPDPVATGDLRFRLEAIIVPIPPLRDRADDVPVIAEALLMRVSEAYGRSFRTIDRQVSEMLRRHSWPGNLRELENLLRSVVLMHEGEVVLPEMITPILRLDRVSAGPQASEIDRLLLGPLDNIERWVIERVIDREGSSIPRAARALGISPSTVYRKIEAWEQKDKHARDGQGNAPIS
jgi:DNA-binding NtrC family response regulator